MDDSTSLEDFNNDLMEDIGVFSDDPSEDQSWYDNQEEESEWSD